MIWVVTIAREDVALGMCPYVGAAHRPRNLRADLEHTIELERDGMREDPECKVRAWLDKLADVNHQWFRAQDMSIQELLNYDELREKLASLEETRKAAEHKLAVLKDHREYIEKLERGKEAVLEHYATIATEAFDSLNPEERRHLYRMLRLKAVQHPDGTLEAEVSGIPEPVLVR